MSEPSDFRSDTVTRPTDALRRAMAEARVGDDVFGDDPTVIELEQELARRFGKEAALLVPSGTMGNVCAIRAHTAPGDEIICEERSHIFLNEGGASAWICGVQARTLPSARGAMDPAAVAGAVREEDVHHPRTGLVCVENTHNYHGGAVVPMGNLRAIAQVARERRIPVHIDGARIWNASVASGVSLAEYGEVCDSIQVCFSKGLGCPIGSALVGTRALIATARRVRKALGGGMRQAGVIAAPILAALRGGAIERMAEDHANALALARGLAGVAGVSVDPGSIETNLVWIRPPGAPARWSDFEAGLAERGVRACVLGELGMRFVTHRDVGESDVKRAIEAAHATAKAMARS